VDQEQLSAALEEVERSENPDLPCVRIADVIYGRKHGMLLAMDVLKPANQNGAGVIWVASGGFISNHGMIAGEGFVRYMEPFLKRGYTVFAVLHGSMPKYEMREITADCHRAVRFIRHHAEDFGVDPKRIGISGASAGASLALLIGTKGGPGDPKASDPVDRESSRVQSVACFFPGTDWLNFLADGVDCLQITQRRGLIDGFRFREYDPRLKEHVLITDPKRVEKILRDYSPVNWATRESAPALMIHGEKDVMPPHHSTRMADELKAQGVPAEVIIKKGEGHGWSNMEPDMQRLADWHDRHLAPDGATQ
jgi:acetyl esterase/lipase